MIDRASEYGIPFQLMSLVYFIKPARTHSRASQIFLIHFTGLNMKKSWLTINMYINAWLDCTNPYISVHNKFDDDVLAHFNTAKVNQLIADGEIAVEDFQSSDPFIQMDIITDLIAIQSSERIKKQVKNIGLSLKKRESKNIHVQRENPTESVRKSKKIHERYTNNLFPIATLKAI